MRQRTVSAVRSRPVQLTVLAALVVAAALIWVTRSSGPVIALDEQNFNRLTQTIQADLFDKYGCAASELAISTPDASGYGTAGLDADGSLPDEVVELFEREIHAIEHVTDYHVEAARVLLLAHDRPNLTSEHSGQQAFSTLTEIVSLTGGAAEVERWEVMQSLFIAECTEAEWEVVRRGLD